MNGREAHTARAFCQNNPRCEVLGGGLEPPRLTAYAPQTYVSAISPPELFEAERLAAAIDRASIFSGQITREPVSLPRVRFLLIFVLTFTAQISAIELAAPANTRQLVVVATRDWTDASGTLRRFSRGKSSAPWRAVGPAISVKVGHAGMAWGLGLHMNPPTGPHKIEGDKKAPAGVFRLTAAFGRGTKPASVTLPYIRVLPSIEAVDDPNSRHYNRIVDRARIADPDWHSSEKMHAVGEEYRLGIIVAHNPAAISGAGSCIFLHVWQNPNRGTSGCTAMPRESIAELQRWLSPNANPVLIQAPREFLPPALR